MRSPIGPIGLGAFTDGELTGAAPCNRYRAPYTLDGAQLAIGPIAATRALCGDPRWGGP